MITTATTIEQATTMLQDQIRAEVPTYNLQRAFRHCIVSFDETSHKGSELNYEASPSSYSVEKILWAIEPGGDTCQG